MILRMLCTFIFGINNALFYLSLLFLFAYCGSRWGGNIYPPTMLEIFLWSTMPIYYISNKWLRENYFKESILTINNFDEKFFINSYLQEKNNNSYNFREKLEEIKYLYNSIFTRDPENREKNIFKLKERIKSREKPIEQQIGSLMLKESRLSWTLSIFFLVIISMLSFLNERQKLSDASNSFDITIFIFIGISFVFGSLFFHILGIRKTIKKLVREYKKRQNN